mgnify:CR=1 FL=1
MPEDFCNENCSAHSGQEEKIHGVSGKMNLVLWLLGILITLIGIVGGGLYSSVQTLNVSLASLTGKFTTIEMRLTNLETSGVRVTDRLDRLEFKGADRAP